MSRLVTPKLTRHIPHEPTPKQSAFLLLDHLEAFYGGAGGGGKSDGLLMAALQYADVPGYAAILFRRTLTDLSLPEALMDRSHHWLDGTSAQWNGQTNTWSFPTGGDPARLVFGYMDNDRDRQRYSSAAFQFVGFDEVTQFPQKWVMDMFARLRRLKGSVIPIRLRSASNPGGIGHDWVKARYVEASPSEGRPFIRALLADNPFLDQAAYQKSLMFLDPITREQILRGDWTVREGGNLFRREWFEIVDALPAETAKTVRYWDLAATEQKNGDDPDWTRGALMVKSQNGLYYIRDMKKARSSSFHVEQLISQTAKLDGRDVPIYIEQEPGSSGKALINNYIRTILAGYAAHGNPVTGDKVTRAAPVASQAEAGNIKLLRGSWNAEFLDELEAFPNGPHDDQVDAVSGAFGKLTGVVEPTISFL